MKEVKVYLMPTGDGHTVCLTNYISNALYPPEEFKVEDITVCSPRELSTGQLNEIRDSRILPIVQEKIEGCRKINRFEYALYSGLLGGLTGVLFGALSPPQHPGAILVGTPVLGTLFALIGYTTAKDEKEKLPHLERIKEKLTSTALSYEIDPYLVDLETAIKEKTQPKYQRPRDEDDCIACRDVVREHGKEISPEAIEIYDEQLENWRKWKREQGFLSRLSITLFGT
jgi:hypothetical protein